METSMLYRLLGALALGQFASLLITMTGFASTELTLQGIDVPTTQSVCSYSLVGVLYGTIFLIRRKPAQERWYYYLLLALVDVEGNYLVVGAYQYTSLTSVMLLDCWAIPCVIFLTWLLMKTKYTVGQLVGTCCCILGLGLVVLSDVHANDISVASNAVLGDAMVIIGSTFYAFSNVGQEFLIKNKVDLIELMAFMGLFGALISGCQVIILERQELASINWTNSAILPFVGYTTSAVLFYSIVPFIFKISGATLLNLSLLTSDMWAVAIRVFAYHQVVDWIFFIAFAMVAFGLVVYSTSQRRDNGIEEAKYTKVNSSFNEYNGVIESRDSDITDGANSSPTIKVKEMHS